MKPCGRKGCRRRSRRFPVKFREVIVLRDIQELSYEEIASITGLAVGTVKSRINRARMRLRTILHDLWTG